MNTIEYKGIVYLTDNHPEMDKLESILKADWQRVIANLADVEAGLKALQDQEVPF